MEFSELRWFDSGTTLLFLAANLNDNAERSTAFYSFHRVVIDGRLFEYRVCRKANCVSTDGQRIIYLMNSGFRSFFLSGCATRKIH